VVLTPPNNLALHAAVPRSTWQPYADAGHAMMYQYPYALGQAVDEYLALRNAQPAVTTGVVF